MRELKIGEEIRIRCVESQDATCTNCIFTNRGCNQRCSAYTRMDGKNVHFEIVEEV